MADVMLTSEQAQRLVELVQQMADCYVNYGCGFYGQPEFCDGFEEAAVLVGRDLSAEPEIPKINYG